VIPTYHNSCELSKTENTNNSLQIENNNFQYLYGIFTICVHEHMTFVQLSFYNEGHIRRMIRHLPPEQWTPHHTAKSSTGHHAHCDVTTIVVAPVVVVWIWIISVDHCCLSRRCLNNYSNVNKTILISDRTKSDDYH